MAEEKFTSYKEIITERRNCMFDEDTGLSFYLRGYTQTYIKKELGFDIKQELNDQKVLGFSYTKEDIIKYQIEYIKSHYTNDDVENAYIEISKKYPVLSKASRAHQIFVLDCCFGSYTPVFKVVIGEKRYKELQNKLWKEKQTKVVMEKYGVDNVFRKETFSDFVTDEAVKEGRVKRNKTMLERYGVLEPNQNPEIKNRMLETLKQTNLEKYGVEYAMQNPEIAKLSSELRQESMLHRYGAANSVQIPEIKEKIFQSRRKNGTLSSSASEDALYELLIKQFGEFDVLRNVEIDHRYPFKVDFYIKSLDLFIELNGDASHGGHWFNSNDSDDQKKLLMWTEKLNESGNKSTRYKKMIETWTVRDVLKRKTAKENDLNYVVFWDARRKLVNGVSIPRLKDANEWIRQGCPLRKDWM